MEDIQKSEMLKKESDLEWYTRYEVNISNRTCENFFDIRNYWPTIS